MLHLKTLLPRVLELGPCQIRLAKSQQLHCRANAFLQAQLGVGESEHANTAHQRTQSTQHNTHNEAAHHCHRYVVTVCQSTNITNATARPSPQHLTRRVGYAQVQRHCKRLQEWVGECPCEWRHNVLVDVCHGSTIDLEGVEQSLRELLCHLLVREQTQRSKKKTKQKQNNEPHKSKQTHRVAREVGSIQLHSNTAHECNTDRSPSGHTVSTTNSNSEQVMCGTHSDEHGNNHRGMWLVEVRHELPSPAEQHP